jgi:hypothetical protein
MPRRQLPRNDLGPGLLLQDQRQSCEGLTNLKERPSRQRPLLTQSGMSGNGMRVLDASTDPDGGMVNGSMSTIGNAH